MSRTARQAAESGCAPRHALVWALAAALVCILPFLPSLTAGFVNWDDDIHITDNPRVKTLDWRHVSTIFSSIEGLYHPLTILSFAVDHHFFGMNARWFHAENVLMHGLVCFLLFLFAARLLGCATPSAANEWRARRPVPLPEKGGTQSSEARGSRSQFNWQSAITNQQLAITLLATLLFGLHPLRAEAVAWISGRKDLLSTLFFLCGLLAYLSWTGSRRMAPYCLAFVCSALALLAKPMAVTFPVVCLLLDWFFNASRTRPTGPTRPTGLPLIGLSLPAVALGIVTIATFRASGGAQAAPGVSLADRLALPAHLLCVYFWKAVMPARLLPMYPDVTAPFMAAWIPVLAIGGLCLLLRWAPLLRLLLFGAAFSVVTLLPVLHLVHIQQQAKVFDHYTYLPGIGFALAVAAAVRAVVILRPALRPLFIAAMIVSCIGLAALSWRQCGIWRDNITLWTYVLKLRPECAEAFNNRGIARQQQKDWAGAVADYSAALSQGFFWAVLNRGTAYGEAGEYQRAIADADLALEVQPDLAAAWNNRADVCLKLKRYDEALSNADHAVALQPRRAVLHLTRAEILAAMGHHQHAIEAYDHALELEPENVNAVSGRTAVLQRQKL